MSLSVMTLCYIMFISFLFFIFLFWEDLKLERTKQKVTIVKNSSLNRRSKFYWTPKQKEGGSLTRSP